MKIKPPWRAQASEKAEQVRTQTVRAERQLREARAARQHAERLLQAALRHVDENHISPKLEAIFREGRV